jgi:hypothetical protein
MSTSETYTCGIGACPCGKGQILRSVTTQDNPWSTADIGYSIGCHSCNREWRIQHGSLVNLASEKPFNAAYAAERDRHTELDSVINPLVDSYFSSFAAKTKMVEHAEMKRLGIFQGNYRDYLSQRSKGKAYSQCCYGRRNPTWLQSLADRAGVRSRLDVCIRLLDEAKQASEAASRGVIRMKIPE